MGDFTVDTSMMALLWALTIAIVGINVSTVLDFFFDKNAVSLCMPHLATVLLMCASEGVR
jgi:hypothetical protein